MNNLESKLEALIEGAINDHNITAIAQLTSALAVLRTAEASQENAANIEKTLAAFAGLAEALKQAAGQFDPAVLAKMMQQGKGV